MALLDWILVVFGAAVAFAGGWIQLHPERVVPLFGGQSQDANWPLDSRALSQIRLLGGCFLFMGTFFALQLTVDLTLLPWWIGTLGGFAAAVASVVLINSRVRRQRLRRRVVQQGPLPPKALELR